MASTYSPGLGIELPGTGDQAGVWGNTTNTNLGTLIEQAISGYVTQAVATGTDTTITIPNGATGVARNMYLELTGTGGASTNLIVPANKKLYFIFNNTSSGQVTVKVSGQTGISVPNGKKMILVSNGTDIVTAENYVASLSSDNLTLTGTLAVGSTSTFTGAATFSAGTANQVQYLNASKVLTGSANLTFDGTTLTANALTLTNNPTLSGGTANGVLYLNGSKVATSGSALAFNGTTLSVTGNVSSSNAGNENYFLSDGSTRSSLQQSSNAFYYNVNDNSATSGSFIWRNTNAFSELMRLTSTGLGIGTSSPAYKLQVSTNANADATINASNTTDGTSSVARFLAISNAGSVWFGMTAPSYNAVTGASDACLINTGNASNGICFANDGVLQMKLDSSGNLGIGTSSPAVKLQILDAGGANSTGTMRLGGTTYYGTIQHDPVSTGANIYDVTAASGGGHIFRRGGSNLMLLDSSGNLGLGVTPSAWAFVKAFQIQRSSLSSYSDATPNASTQITTNGYYDGNWKYIASGIGAAQYNQSTISGGSHQWSVAGTGTAGNTISGFSSAAMTLDASGNLGVGTTSPGAKLGLGGSADISMKNTANTSGFDIGLLGGSSDAAAYIYQRANSHMAFATNNTERGRFTAGGQFKVGATAIADVIGWFDNSHASTPYGLYVDFSAASPDNNSQYFLRAEDSTTVRCYIWSDGDLANHDGVYGTISDERLKQDIVDAGSQWDDLKSIRFRKYRMKTDVEANPDAPAMFGVVAQELAQVCPGLVDEHPNMKTVEVTDEEGNVTKTQEPDGTTTMTVKSSILLMKAAKALQEAMARIESLEADVAALKGAK